MKKREGDLKADSKYLEYLAIQQVRKDSDWLYENSNLEANSGFVGVHFTKDEAGLRRYFAEYLCSHRFKSDFDAWLDEKTAELKKLAQEEIKSIIDT